MSQAVSKQRRNAIKLLPVWFLDAKLRKMPAKMLAACSNGNGKSLAAQVLEALLAKHYEATKQILCGIHTSCPLNSKVRVAALCPKERRLEESEETLPGITSPATKFLKLLGVDPKWESSEYCD